jgi:predicted DNA-binding transcriptional regulator AlpA
MKLKDYLPLKAVADDLGVSRWTLWRAAGSEIEGFPAPTRVGRQIYWKKSELEALEAALMQFKGRCVFDRQRKRRKLVTKLARAKRSSAPKQKSKPTASAAAGQRDLFS